MLSSWALQPVIIQHDDVIKWKYFPRYWPFVRGIHPSTVNSPHKSQWRGALMFSLICALNKLLGKQSRGWWFETPSRSLWRHWNITVIFGSPLILKYGTLDNGTCRDLHPHWVLLATPCLLPRIWEFIHTQHRNTTRSGKIGIVMLRVDKFPYPRKQTTGNEFIPCSNDVCHFLRCFHSFKIPAVAFILPKSPC